MKKLFLIAVSLILSVTTSMELSAKDTEKNKESKRILIVGLHDNVKSNYYYEEWIAREAGTDVDSIDYRYNTIIANNISEAAKGDFVFLSLDEALCADIVNNIKVEGEGEECKSDLTNISNEKLQQLLDTADADYLLVLNQHYLKWQEKPMRTLFHMVSYSVFDRNKNDLLNGNNYFTSMNLEKLDKTQKISKKTSMKIASNVMKNLPANK